MAMICEDESQDMGSLFSDSSHIFATGNDGDVLLMGMDSFDKAFMSLLLLFTD